MNFPNWIRFLVAVAVLTITGCRTGKHRTDPTADSGQLNALPETLEELQLSTGYPEWEALAGFSRSLDHYRRLRFNPGSNVFISETGAHSGQLDVVEVILMPRDPEDTAEFGLYDPTSGDRLTQYPESVQFEVEGLPDNARTPAPALCTACHSERQPLISLIPWSQKLQEEVEKARRGGQGIRADLLIIGSTDPASMDRLASFNAIMHSQYPGRVIDIQEWIRP